MIDLECKCERTSHRHIAIRFNKHSEIGHESNTSSEVASGHSVKTYRKEFE